MIAQIDIFGPYSIIKGEFPLNEIMYETSYFQEGAEFSPAFRKKKWDGRVNLFNRRSKSFPTGLLSTVQRVCKENNVEVTTVDHRITPKIEEDSFDLHGITMTGKYDYQMDACVKAVKAKQGILKMATGAGKSNVGVAITKCLGVPTLFIVPTRELMLQMRKSYMDLLNIHDDTVIGIIGDGEWNPGSWVTIAIIDTLASRLEDEETVMFLSTIDCIILDEAHRSGSNSYYDVAQITPAYYRFGLSATPLDRTDGANLRLLATTGDIIVDIPSKILVERGVIAKADIIFDKITTPVLPKKKFPYQSVYKVGIVENVALTQKIVDWTVAFRENNLSVLIMVEEIAHGNSISDALWTDSGGSFIPHTFIHGSESSEVRDKALADFSDRKLPVLIASRILDEGVSVNAIDVLILAGSRKSKIKTMQRLGRGLRGTHLLCLEFCHYTHKYLIAHSLQRLEDYKSQGCFNIVQFKEDSISKKDLIKQLWDKQTQANETRLEYND